VAGAGATDPNGEGAWAVPPKGDPDSIPDEPKGVPVAGALPKGVPVVGALPNGVAEDSPPTLDDPKGDGEEAREPNAGAGAMDPKVEVGIAGAGALNPNGDADIAGAGALDPNGDDVPLLDPKREPAGAGAGPLEAPNGDAIAGEGATDPNGEGNVEALGEPVENGDGSLEPNVDVDGAAEGVAETSMVSSGLGTLYLAASF